MFCRQCEQTFKEEGCYQLGACGKSPEVDALQDLLIHCLRGLAEVGIRANHLGIDTRAAGFFTCEALFSTLTNVNFDPDRFVDYIYTGVKIRDNLKAEINGTSVLTRWSSAVDFIPCTTKAELIQQGRDIERDSICESQTDSDIFSVKLTILYGLKGIASYAYHAAELGQEDKEVYAFFYHTLVTLDRGDRSLDEWVAIALRVGSINLRVMELLDRAHTSTYGHPVPTDVPLNAKLGKAILVSGHNLKDLEAILKQTEGKEITIYTHGELLPAHGYPKLKQKYPHLYGHYGTAWHNQTREFSEFPGAIVMTTNCLMPPRASYHDRLFTCGPVGWQGVSHISNRDFTPVIQKALELPEFNSETSEVRTVMTGLARHAVLSRTKDLIDAVKRGDIRHFFLVGGCDGAKSKRSYYTELVEKVPSDCVVLTLGCGKFRFFDKELGEIDGFSRLMDAGQCNDAYSAIQIALGLAKALKININQLPLSLILSWYEQKAIAILLSLLYLGIQDIRLGPTLPAFITPNVFQLLESKYHIKVITTPDEDLAACLGVKSF
jgi:hydroxylamine reductase